MIQHLPFFVVFTAGIFTWFMYSTRRENYKLFYLSSLLLIGSLCLMGCAGECMRQHRQVLQEISWGHAAQLEQYEADLKKCRQERLKLRRKVEGLD